ncbi:MAG: YceI family protein [Thermoanaerobaculia bacterium]
MRIPRFLLLAVLTAGAAPATAERLTIDPAGSVLAILTHKAGFASGAAHDHLVTAPVTALELDFDHANPEATRASLVVPVDSLEIDHFAARRRYRDRMREIGFGPAELAPVADSDRQKVRKAMLGESQLDAAHFPEIRAELLSFARAAEPSGEFDRLARLRITIHGRTIERDLAARYEANVTGVLAEAWGELLFSEFGIEPYSAVLGAVKNQDRIHLYVRLVAAPAGAGATTVAPPPVRERR